jgi:hypothetical protein
MDKQAETRCDLECVVEPSSITIISCGKID